MPTAPAAPPPQGQPDPAEIAKFEAMAAEWWDPAGKFRPLHMLNPCRLDYVRTQIAAEFDRDPDAPKPLAGLRLLDLGCGGGLVSEPMARLGADVVGADPGARNIPVARLHAAQAGLDIDYRVTTAEALAAAGERFDVVLAMEVIEHVPDPAAFVAACRTLLRPGGLLVLSTLNRTARSFAMAIVGAEYLLGWLPRGTHDWRRFLTPDEVAQVLRDAGLEPVDRKGMVFDPLHRRWTLSDDDLGVNHLAAAVRPA